MTTVQARDQIFTLLKTAWASGAPGAVASAYTPALYYQGQEPLTAPPMNLAHGKVTLTHVTGRQTSLASSDSTKRWTRGGIIIVQCLAPISSGKGLTIAESLAVVANNAFEGKTTTGGAWFRNCRLNEVGPKDGWFAINAITDFLYDEVK